MEPCNRKREDLILTVTVWCSGFFLSFYKFLHNFYNPSVPLTRLSDFVPVLVGCFLYNFPLVVRDGGELELFAVYTVVCFTPPVPDEPVVVRLVYSQLQHRFQMIGKRFPGFGMGEPAAGPGTRDWVGEIVVV